MLFRPLEGVAADDGAEAAAVADGAGLVENHLVVVLLGPAGEDDNPRPIEGALDNVADTAGERVNRHRSLDVGLAGFLLLDVGGRQLDLNNMRAELGGD